MQFFYVIFFIIAVIIKLVIKSTSVVAQAGEDAFGKVFNEVKCPYCGLPNNKKDKFCIHCGKPLAQTNETPKFQNTSKKFCTKCFTQNGEGNNFCIKCGNNLFSKYDISAIENSIGGYVAVLSAFIVKADNIVSNVEAQLVGDMLRRLSNGDEEFKNALVAIFNKAKNNTLKHHIATTEKLYSLIFQQISYSERNTFYMSLGYYFMELVYIDGEFNSVQNNMVIEILRTLKISDQEINNIRSEFIHEKNQSNNHRNLLDEAYKVLNCKPSDSDEVVKKAYKDLAKQFHPDTISGKGLADEFLKFANQRFQEINNAYDLIKKSRGMR